MATPSLSSRLAKSGMPKMEFTSPLTMFKDKFPQYQNFSSRDAQTNPETKENFAKIKARFDEMKDDYEKKFIQWKEENPALAKAHKEDQENKARKRRESGQKKKNAETTTTVEEPVVEEQPKAKKPKVVVSNVSENFEKLVALESGNSAIDDMKLTFELTKKEFDRLGEDITAMKDEMESLRETHEALEDGMVKLNRKFKRALGMKQEMLSILDLIAKEMIASKEHRMGMSKSPSEEEEEEEEY